MKKINLAVLSLLFLFSACQKDSLKELGADDSKTVEQEAPLSVEKLNEQIHNYLVRNERIVDWDDMDDHTIYSAAVQSDSVVSFIYQPMGYGARGNYLMDMKNSDLKEARDKVMAYVLETMNAQFPGRNFTEVDLFAFEEDENVPVLDLKIWSKSLITDLRQMPEVHKFAPMGYDDVYHRAKQNQRSIFSSGCGNNDTNVNGGDWTPASPGAAVSWHLSAANVPTAWNTSTGDNIGVAVIDTGVDSGQDFLNYPRFTSGHSGGRWITKKSFKRNWLNRLDTSTDDDCGHGTRMAGIIAGPRTSPISSWDPKVPTGIAYDANLYCLRATNSVLVTTSKGKRGVRDAINWARTNYHIKITSMSMGSLSYDSGIASAIINYTNANKLFICAAGTSPSWVPSKNIMIFPATMSQTIATTGVKENGSRCSECHEGSAVDITVILERNSDKKRLGVGLDKDQNPDSKHVYIGGSSTSTATVAGIAALVWAKNPSQSAASVRSQLFQASSNFPNRHSKLGFGSINAATAVN